MPESVVGGTGCHTEEARLGKRLKREIHVVGGFESRAWKVYGKRWWA